MTRQLAVLVAVAPFLWWGLAAKTVPPAMPQAATLEDLSRGYPVAIQPRFRVVRVELAASDVSPLFLLTASRQSGAHINVIIKLRSQRLMHQLQTMLAHQAAPQLTLVLADFGLQSSIYRTLPQALQLGVRFEQAMHIPIVLNPCEAVTAIIYANIDASLPTKCSLGSDT